MVEALSGLSEGALVSVVDLATPEPGTTTGAAEEVSG